MAIGPMVIEGPSVTLPLAVTVARVSASAVNLLLKVFQSVEER